MEPAEQVRRWKVLEVLESDGWVVKVQKMEVGVWKAEGEVQKAEVER